MENNYEFGVDITRKKQKEKNENAIDYVFSNEGCAFSYDGIYLAVTHSTTPFITIYKRSGDTFIKL